MFSIQSKHPFSSSLRRLARTLVPTPCRPRAPAQVAQKWHPLMDSGNENHYPALRFFLNRGGPMRSIISRRADMSSKDTSPGSVWVSQQDLWLEPASGVPGAWPWPHVGSGEGQHHLEKLSPTEKHAAGQKRRGPEGFPIHVCSPCLVCTCPNTPWKMTTESQSYSEPWLTEHWFIPCSQCTSPM